MKFRAPLALTSARLSVPKVRMHSLNAKNTFYRHQIACEYLAHRAVNSAQWQRVCESLSPAQIVALDALLETDEADKESAFARLCRGPGKATRENLKVLIEHHPWLREL